MRAFVNSTRRTVVVVNHCSACACSEELSIVALGRMCPCDLGVASFRYLGNGHTMHATLLGQLLLWFATNKQKAIVSSV